LLPSLPSSASLLPSPLLPPPPPPPLLPLLPALSTIAAPPSADADASLKVLTSFVIASSSLAFFSVTSPPTTAAVGDSLGPPPAFSLAHLISLS
jgi:hypothetical protein